MTPIAAALLTASMHCTIPGFEMAWRWQCGRYNTMLTPAHMRVRAPAHKSPPAKKKPNA